MTFETTRWDVTEFLDSDEAIAAYLDAVFEAGDLTKCATLSAMSPHTTGIAEAEGRRQRAARASR